MAAFPTGASNDSYHSTAPQNEKDAHNDAIYVAATELHCVATRVEPSRLRKLTRVVSIVGSPTNHMFSNDGRTENTFTCPICDRLVTPGDLRRRKGRKPRPTSTPSRRVGQDDLQGTISSPQLSQLNRGGVGRARLNCGLKRPTPHKFMPLLKKGGLLPKEGWMVCEKRVNQYPRVQTEEL
jgi:hypothetical protein